MALINGTNNNDQIFGTSDADLINGFLGNDLIFGDAGDDILDGGTGADTLRGGSGNDSYLVSDSNDVVIENANDGIDTVFAAANFTLSANVENLLMRAGTIGIGNELNNRIELPAATLTAAPSVSFSGLGGDDTLITGVGNDTLDGGAGNDTMLGGGGNDTYGVDSIGDVITEEVGAGIDLVRSSISHTLAANLENLDLAVFANVNGTGNELDNTITGRGGNNVLEGLAGNDSLTDVGFGNDTLRGGIGADLLSAGSGDDELDGGIGADRMLGDLGNDTYIVDDAGDIVDEGNGVLAPNLVFGGIDLVRASIDFTLTRNVENLTLQGTAALNGTGNELNNILTANNSANVLDGQAGNDSLLGLNGNDVLRGGAGNDQLVGGRGRDVLTGGEGADAFIFDIGAPFNRSAIGKDLIKDFVTSSDKIVLDQTTFGNISRSDFSIVADDIDAAANAKLIVYSEATGRLFFNQNGSSNGFGQGGYFVTLQSAPSITANDINIQA